MLFPGSGVGLSPGLGGGMLSSGSGTLTRARGGDIRPAGRLSPGSEMLSPGSGGRGLDLDSGEVGSGLRMLSPDCWGVFSRLLGGCRRAQGGCPQTAGGCLRAAGCCLRAWGDVVFGLGEVVSGLLRVFSRLLGGWLRASGLGEVVSGLLEGFLQTAAGLSPG